VEKMPKLTTAYEAHDGQLFKDEKECARHNYKLAVDKMLTAATNATIAERVSRAVAADQTSTVAAYLKDMRDLHEAVRNCYYDLHGEFPK
jgi:hypothetical protein